MIDLDHLEALAKAAGSGEWTAGDQVVWFGDGDSALHAMNPVAAFIAHDNLGAWPDAIAAEDVAKFAAAVCPAKVLSLIAEVRALREDAEHWRLARDQAMIYQGNNVGCFVEFKKYDAEPAERTRSGKAFTDAVDAAIDAARAKEPK